MSTLTDRITGLFGASGINQNGTVRDVTSAASFSLDEYDTGLDWIDGRPVFGRVVRIPGGNGLSFDTVAGFAGTQAIDISAIGPAGVGTSQVTIFEAVFSPDMAPQVSVNHVGLDLTGQFVTMLIRYVKNA